MLGAIILVMFFGFVTGGLARLAVPGPDPMPVWLTVAIGLPGSVVEVTDAKQQRMGLFKQRMQGIGRQPNQTLAYRDVVGAAEQTVHGMESEGAKIYFRNVRIRELPPGVTSPEQTAADAQ